MEYHRGFYFLKGSLVLLDLALQRYALDLLAEKGFTPVIPPYMINRSSYEGVTDLSDFEKVMYKIDGDDTYLITAGFRQRWELVAHHCQAITAFAAYLRHCQQEVLPAAAECHWWAWQSQATRLWQKDYRPSALRTVHDLNEVLLDARRSDFQVRRPNSGGLGSPPYEPRAAEGTIPQPRGRALQSPMGFRHSPHGGTDSGSGEPSHAQFLAHRAADLMERLETIYGTVPTACDDVELLSQALLLTRGAFELCQGSWPGWMSIEGMPPGPLPQDAAERRHHLIDWLAGRLEAPIAAA